MNKKIILSLPLLICFLLQGCLKDKVLLTYTILTPVYKDKTEVYAQIKSNPPEQVKKPGKIFLFGNYIFLNEVDKGVHIIDNSDPTRPLSKAFINIPGNLDITVKGTTLYADLYSDLVVVDIADPLDARFVKYIPSVFPERNYSNGFVADSSKVIVDWIKKDTTVRNDNYAKCNRCDFVMLSNQSSGGSAAAGGPVGVSGSMARFAIINEYLYTVNRTKLTSYSISNPKSPVQTASQQIGWNIETIYPFRNNLFIGSMSGMFIFDISNPATPVSTGQFSHARSCDPVVTDGNYAYVTLRGGTNCGGFTNQLDILDVANLRAPRLIRTVPMKNPFGLALDNNLLFVCDGNAGLKMYDVTNPVGATLTKEVLTMDTYDAIAYNGNLIVTAQDGLYQFGYAFPSTLSLRSKLAANR